MKNKSKYVRSILKEEILKIILIIPAYNEEKNIIEVCNKIEKLSNYEYLVINDGSEDLTEDILCKNKINHVQLLHNLGIGGAVQTGYKYAYENGFDIAIQFDGDGQHDVNYISKLIKPIIEDDIDMVIGSRFLKDSNSNFKSTRLRRIGKSIISFLIRILWKQKVTDPTSGFRAINRKVLKEFAKEYPTDYPEPESIVTVLKLNFKVREVPISMNQRISGKSFVNPWTSLIYMIKVIFSIGILSIGFKTFRGKQKCQ